MGLVRQLTDLILPPTCAGCGAVADPPLCRACRADALRIRLPGGASTALAEGVIAVGAFRYAGPIAAAIRAVKVSGLHAAGAGLGQLMRETLELPAGVVTWVPASRTRRRQRGFDLAQLLAGPGAIRMLARIADRPDQTALDRAARRASPWGSFAATKAAPERIVLVDDVRTTGATVSAAGSVLRAAGARQVLVATLAVAGRSPGAPAGVTTRQA